MIHYFVTQIPEDGNYVLTTAGYASVALAFCIALGIIFFLGGKNNTAKKIQTKQLIFSAMAIALATVVSVVLKLPSLPNGGSITLFSMLIICLTGYWYGPRIGIAAAFAYGILQFITGPYIIHPAQVLLDYPLAFGALGLSGFFWKSKHGLVKGYALGVFGRFAFHMISGLIFYTAYTGSSADDIAAILASTIYNLSYILPEAVLTILLLYLPPVQNLMHTLKRMAVE